jgi:rare lipoprotein A
LQEHRGIASWYGLEFHGRRTASGERFDMNALTAAHPTLPFGTRVRVLNPRNGRSIEVRINDRGPHVRGRIIDLSHAAARAIGHLGWGAKSVVVTPLAEGRSR